MDELGPQLAAELTCGSELPHCAARLGATPLKAAASTRELRRACAAPTQAYFLWVTTRVSRVPSGRLRCARPHGMQADLFILKVMVRFHERAGRWRPIRAAKRRLLGAARESARHHPQQADLASKRISQNSRQPPPVEGGRAGGRARDKIRRPHGRPNSAERLRLGEVST